MIENKKIYTLLVFGAILFILILLIIYYLFYSDKSDNLSTDYRYPPSVIEVLQNPVNRVTETFIDLAVEDDYIISYGGDLNDGTFYITVNAEPVVEVSKRAEQHFLDLLDIRSTEACSLYVILNVPSIIDDNLGEYDFGLSFCPDRVHIEDVPRQTNRAAPYTGDLIIEDDVSKTNNIR